MKAALYAVRWALMGALLLASAGLAVAIYGEGLHSKAAFAHAQVRAVFLESQQRLGSVYAERQEIDDYLPRYNTLKTMGALDDERRLEWIERLTAIRDDLRLPRLTYAVAPRLPNPALAEPAAGLVFESSRMTLDFALVHEGDLLQILRRLREPPVGILEVQSCSITRKGVAGGLEPDPPEGRPDGNLAGNCQFDWITLTGSKPPVAADAPAVPPRAGGAS